MNEFYIRNVLEAALLAAGKPLQLAELCQLFDETARPKTDDIRAALDALATEYANRGVELKETAAGYRIQVRREFSTEVSRLWPERPVKYSRALLETLALIAYRQPITRAEIEAVRGVAVNPNIIKTVIERNWVRVVGHRDVPGRPELLGTTREFLDYFGLRSLDELPPLAEIKTLGDYNPQLELPSGVPALEAPEGEGLNGGADGSAMGVAGVAVAGLLTNESAASDLASSAADGARDGAVESADLAIGVPETSTVAAASEAVATGDAEGNVSEAGAPEVPTSEVATPELPTEGATLEVDAASVASPGSPDPVAQREHVESDAEAERMLRAGEGSSQHGSAEGEDADAKSRDSLDAVDDSSDEEADEDELSADGHGSRELVAGPRDLDG
jgi:segregation and condensation protein B